MPGPFHTTRLVEFADTDMAGIIHFSSFFRYMESAEHEMLRSWGYSIYDTSHDDVISFPRVSVSCEFHAPVTSEDVLDIDVYVGRVGNKSVNYKFAFACEGKQIATGHVTCVCCRIEHGKPPTSIVIPMDLAKKLRDIAATS